MTQWFLKITDYAEELLSDLDKIDWPEKTKLMQKNWIGKSTGCEIHFECETGDTITVFTTRPDTVFGVNYVVLAPEHPLVEKLKAAHPEQAEAIDKYVQYAAEANDIDRLSTARGRVCDSSLNEQTSAHLPCRLRTLFLRYGRGNGGSGARRARLRVCNQVRLARYPSHSKSRRRNAPSLLRGRYFGEQRKIRRIIGRRGARRDCLAPYQAWQRR